MTHMLSTFIHETVYNRFLRGFRWALIGSLTYETLKIVHLFFLFKILDPSLYGTMGSILAGIYFAMYVADAGASNSLLPFLHLCLKSRLHCKRFLTRYYLVPHLPFIVVCASVLVYFINNRLGNVLSPFLLALIFIIVILETLRTCARVFLYATFQARFAVTVEVSFFFFYVLALWIPYLLGKHAMTLSYMIAVHALDSLIVSFFFFFLIRQFYYTLPPSYSSINESNNESNGNQSSTISDAQLFPATLVRRLFVTRFFNYILRLSRSFFSSNFLTPFFAIRFGLQAAGVFYLASMIASALYSVVKTSVGYSGSALLASIKESPLSTKKAVFNELFGKLIFLMIPMVSFVIINYHLIIGRGTLRSVTNTTLAFCLLFFFIQFTEFFFMIYEQFYVLEEASGKLFLFKTLEMTMFFGFITTTSDISPLYILLGLIVLRLISLFIISMNAFYLWRIHPTWKMHWIYAGLCILASWFIRLIT